MRFWQDHVPTFINPKETPKVITDTIANIKRAYDHFRKQDPDFDTKPQPVIGCPQWFLDEVRALYNVEEPDVLVDQIHGMYIIQRPELSEPILVLADGRYVNVVPAWARTIAAHSQAQALAANATNEVTLPEEAGQVVVARPAERAVEKIANDAAAAA